MNVNKQEFSLSSRRSNQGYTKMHGQPTNHQDDNFCHSTHLTIGTQQSSERWESVSCALGKIQRACILILIAE